MSIKDFYLVAGAVILSLGIQHVSSIESDLQRLEVENSQLRIALERAGQNETPRRIANCTFDNAPSLNDYVTVSSARTGLCHDAGATWPEAGRVLGFATAAGTKPGSYSVALFDERDRF